MGALVCFSVTEEEASRLQASGPRRDITTLAATLGGDLLYRRRAAPRRRLLARIAGPQVPHAWQAAARARRYSVIFADGEHIGIPLLGFLALRRTTRVPVVMLGHLVDRWWKRALLRVTTRLVPGGVLLVHSVRQAAVARRVVSRTWRVQGVPYQVDTEYWTAAAGVPACRPLVVAVGSENRDYDTLAEAVRGLDADVKIAAGSHWARHQAAATTLPANVTYLQHTLTFAELRELYASATLVVVPLLAVGNQSGVTTLLEAMSMAKPLIVSATEGQLEVITGPLVTSTGCDAGATACRGPQLLGLPRDPAPTGLYVPVGDATALRRAISGLLADHEHRRRLGQAAREAAVGSFGLDDFVQRLSNEVRLAASRPSAAVAPS